MICWMILWRWWVRGFKGFLMKEEGELLDDLVEMMGKTI